MTSGKSFKHIKVPVIILSVIILITYVSIGMVKAGVIGQGLKNSGLEVMQDPLTNNASEQLIKQVVKTSGQFMRGVTPESAPGLIRYYTVVAKLSGEYMILDAGPIVVYDTSLIQAANTGGKIIGTGCTVLGGIDTGLSTYRLVTKEYKNMNEAQVLAARTMNLADIGLGVVTTAGGAMVLMGTVTATPAVAGGLMVLGVVKIGNSLMLSYHERDPFNLPLIEMLLKREKNPIKLPPGAMPNFFGVRMPPGVGNIAVPDAGLLPPGAILFNSNGELVQPFGSIIDNSKFQNGIPGMREEMANPSSVGAEVYKPNIYIYSEEDKTIGIKLLYEDMITKSEPKYLDGKGWKADIVNGSINGNGDYLFYEANVPAEYFQKDTGWKIRGERLGPDMSRILELYGFNAKETKDFLEYWTEKLDNSKDYVFYNQETQIVDMVMPLEAIPAVKNRHRIWFLIEEYGGQVYKNPVKVEKINDRKDTLVEWGGIIMTFQY